MDEYQFQSNNDVTGMISTKHLHIENYIYFWDPTSFYLFKANKGNTKTIHEICCKLTIETTEQRRQHRSGVFIVNFEQIIITLFWCFQCWLERSVCRLDLKIFPTKKLKIFLALLCKFYLIFHYIFIILAAPRTTLGHFQRDSLANPMLITAY